MDDTLFHDIASLPLIDGNQILISPNTFVTDALKLMIEHKVQHILVADDLTFYGVFSLWSLAHHLTIASKAKIEGLLVEELISSIPLVNATDSLHSITGLLLEHEALLVQTRPGSRSVIKTSDVLLRYHTIAMPFIMLQEIELALRSIISARVAEDLTRFISKALAYKYAGPEKDLPASLTELTFDDYRALIIQKENWHSFESVFGKNKDIVSSRLEQVRQIRNIVFHFRQKISRSEQITLESTRNWLQGKVQRAMAKE